MSEATGGRRERRKAQTRAEVRQTAQRLFAERGFDGVTIADVAAAADVAVQTVFNHFESKEALFFDGRTPWAEAVVAAVTRRPPGTDPVAALRRYLQDDLIQLLQDEARPENRDYLDVLSRSPSLRVRERTLVEEAGIRVAAALAEAIGSGDWPAGRTADRGTVSVLSRLIADLFLNAGRALVLENRRLLLDQEADVPGRRLLEATATATMSQLEDCVRELAGKLLDRPG